MRFKETIEDKVVLWISNCGEPIPLWSEEARGRSGYWDWRKKLCGESFQIEALTFGRRRQASQSKLEGREMRGKGENKSLKFFPSHLRSLLGVFHWPDATGSQRAKDPIDVASSVNLLLVNNAGRKVDSTYKKANSRHSA